MTHSLTLGHIVIVCPQGKKRRRDDRERNSGACDTEEKHNSNSSRNNSAEKKPFAGDAAVDFTAAATEPHEEDENCFICGEQGNLLLCDFPECPRL